MNTTTADTSIKHGPHRIESTAHTPGPWKAGPVFQETGKAIFFTDENKPGKWQRRLDDKSGVFSEANARLIAAAPELLDALRDALLVLSDSGLTSKYASVRDKRTDAVNDARAAIAKATRSD